VPDPIEELHEYLATVVLADVLAGSGEPSRLFQRLVKQDRIVSHIGGYVGTFGDPLEIRDPTMLQVVAYLQSGTIDDVLTAVDNEVEALHDDLLGDDVERVVNSMTAAFLGEVDHFMQRALTLAVLEQQRSAPELINELPERLREVSVVDVRRAAERWLRPAGRAVLEVQPGNGSTA
jgi:predicted Zn-dependent peptidase